MSVSTGQRVLAVALIPWYLTSVAGWASWVAVHALTAPVTGALTGQSRVSRLPVTPPSRGSHGHSRLLVNVQVTGSPTSHGCRDPRDPSRTHGSVTAQDITAGQGSHGSITAVTRQGSHGSPPLLNRGGT